MVSREIHIVTEGFAFSTGTAWGTGKGNILLGQRHLESNGKGQYNLLRLLNYLELKLVHGFLWTRVNEPNEQAFLISFTLRKKGKVGTDLETSL